MIQSAAEMKRRPVGEADDMSVAHSASCGLTRDNLKRAPAGRHNIGSARHRGVMSMQRGEVSTGSDSDRVIVPMNSTVAWTENPVAIAPGSVP